MATFVAGEVAGASAGRSGDEGPILISAGFKSRNIPELSIDDFELVGHAADGGWGSVFKYRRKSDDQLVAMKFFGMNYTARPIREEIEKEIIKDSELNHLGCVAKLLGYIVDSNNGYTSDVPRYRKECNPYPPYLGKLLAIRFSYEALV